MNHLDLVPCPTSPPSCQPSTVGPRGCHPALSKHLPAQFRNLRLERYQGQDFDTSLSMFTPIDQDRARLLYEYAKNIHIGWLSMRDAPDWELLRTLIIVLLSPPMRAAAKQLGQDTMGTITDHNASMAFSKVLHDLRGGALMSLQLYAHMAEWDKDPAFIRGAVFLARDQAKIMRNALPDLDPEVRSADEAEKPHFMRTVVEKWDGFRFESTSRQPGQVDVNCEYDGLLASCCLEASAVDRVIYNFVNNAIRFSAGSRIRMDILPIGDDTVRWVVTNPITQEQSAWLRAETGGDLTRLFRGGLTQGGNGLGLSNCADFVAAAFGLPNMDAALEGRYLGAIVEDGLYIAWAHWPALYSVDSDSSVASH